MKRLLPLGLAVLAMIVVALAWPALTGDFIYDDLLLLDHPHLSGADDLLAAFGRNSADYLDQAADVGVRSTATWRPISMFTLVLTQAVAGPNPLIHHLFSLLVHLAVVGLLAVALRQRGVGPKVALGLCAVVALHPALGEAWLWINGRSDALAGLALVGSAVLLGGSGAWRAWRWPALGLALVLGALSKETFLPAALALVVAEACWSRSRQWSTPERLGLVGLWLAAAAVFWLGRAATLGDLPTLGGGTLPEPAALVGRAIGLWALALHTLALPAAQGMRLLATALPTLPILVAAGLTVATLIGLGLLLRRRRFAAAVLLLGAGAALAPAALVTDAWWFGFDRYLYLPALLLMLAGVALARTLPPLPAVAPTIRRAALAVALGWGGLAAWSLWMTARAYSGPQAFAIGMTDQRPDDPAGWLWLARGVANAGFPARARAVLAAMPTDPEGHWPPVVSHQLATLHLGLGQPAEAAAVVERAAAARPTHPNLRFDLMLLRMGQRRYDEGLDLASGLLVLPAQRAPVERMLGQWAQAPDLDPSARARCQALLEGGGATP